MPRKLTVADVCAVTGYARDELHALLKVLPPYDAERPAPRVARQFSGKDLLVLSITQVLESRFCVRRTALSQIGHQLQSALSGPRLRGSEQVMVLTIQPPLVRIINARLEETEGILIPLEPLFEQVEAYLSHDPQMSLIFGPSIVRYG